MLQGGRHRALKRHSSIPYVWWREKKEKTQGDTERRNFQRQERRKDSCLLCMFSLVGNDLWKTAGHKKQEEIGRAGPAAEFLLSSGTTSNFQQLIFQSMWVKYLLKNLFLLVSCWGSHEGFIYPKSGELLREQSRILTMSQLGCGEMRHLV